jgi:hypothetical protein
VIQVIKHLGVEFKNKSGQPRVQENVSV